MIIVALMVISHRTVGLLSRLALLAAAPLIGYVAGSAVMSAALLFHWLPGM